MRQFLIILTLIFLIQLPNWYFILGRDGGAINDFGNENWIVVSDWMSTVFSFPIYFFVRDSIDNYFLAFVIYIVDLILIALAIHLIIEGIKKITHRRLNHLLSFMINWMWTMGLTTIVVTSCTVSTDNFPEPEELRMAIANGISLPYATNDTLVYNNSSISFCGNSSQEELNKYYDPHLDETPYLTVLKKLHRRPVVLMGDSLYDVVTARCEATEVDGESPWDCFLKDKILLSLSGEAVTNRSVTINETYIFKGKSLSFEKLFSYNDGQWTYKLIDSDTIATDKRRNQSVKLN
jgi:hypothetical protein